MSTLKKRNKISPEEKFAEFIQETSKAYEGCWIGSKPLFTGIFQKNRYQLFVLHSSFIKGNWMLWFLDLTSYRSQEILSILNEWSNRYRFCPYAVILIIKDTYSFFKNASGLSYFLAQKKFSAILVMDKESILAKTFKAENQSFAILVSRGIPEITLPIPFSNEAMIIPWYQQAEKELQQFFRKNDPGFATFPLFCSSKNFPQDIALIPLGTKYASQNLFNPAFLLGEKKTTFFPPVSISSLSLTDQLILSGYWSCDAEKISTEDSNASLTFWLPCSHFSIIAQSYKKTVDNSILHIQINGSHLYQDHLGVHAHVDESGKAIVRITNAQMYHVCANIPKPCWVSIYFKNLQLAPISIFCIRLGGIDYRLHPPEALDAPVEEDPFF